MDDSKFDDRIKNKVYDYEAPGYDPAALDSLHHQLRSVYSWPWYSRYRTELLVGSGVAVFTLVFLCSQWYFAIRTTDTLNQKIEKLQIQQAEIDKLQEEIQ